MNPRNILTAVLLLFVTGSLAYVATGSLRQADPQTATKSDPAATPANVPATADASASDPQTAPAAVPAADSLIVYYFHGNMRCATCLKFESYTSELLKTAFASQLDSGAIQWRVVNVEDSENRHFITDFELVTKSVVLARMRDGEMTEWVNLDKIWDLAADKTAFTAYIRDNVQAYLGES